MMLSRLRSSRGSVLVLVAAAMFPIVGMMTFAIDVSHWFDYSRNLQNRADAAALAAGGTFGSLCFGSSAGSTSNGAQSAIGKWAQLYSGAGVGEPAGNLPYTDTAVSASPTATPGTGNGPGTGWNVTTNGYINNTLPASPVTSPLTLRKGSLSNFLMILNGTNYAEHGGTNFSMAPGGLGFCNSNPTLDATDKECYQQTLIPGTQLANDCASGAMVDVKLSQRNLGLFFPLFNLTPTINAHARVTLQGEASSPTAPIAVSDTGYTPCVSVNLVNASTGSVMQTVTLPHRTQANPTDPVQWDNSTSPASFTMPTSAHVYVQPFLSDCNGNGQTYDDSTNTGLLMINNHPATDPTVGSGSPPQINTGGVTVSGACTNSTQYFNVGGCTVSVNASVTFANDVSASKAKVFVIEHTWNNTTNTWVTNSPGTQLSRPGTSGCPATAYCGDPQLLDASGIDQFEITWEEDDGTIGTTNCKTNFTPGVCSGTFGIQAQSFDACNGCDQPDDSGPIVFARISEGAANDVNTLASGSTHNLVFTVKLAGINTGQVGDPATVLRFANSTNHQTGLVDCGQGTGTNADSYVVYYGCGPDNPQFTNPPLNPLYVNTRNTCGTPPGPPWPSGNHQDCVQTTPGQRRNGIICPLVLRIVGAPLTNNCNSQNVGVCPANNWKAIGPNGASGGDPRAITMIITSAVDLATGVGKPQAWIPIRQFATFYVTGWDSKVLPQCGDNEAFPVKGKRNSQNGAVWGHWINYTDPGGITNGQACPVTSTTPVNCVPALTR